MGKIASKIKSAFVKNVKLTNPETMQYYVNIEKPKDRKKFIERIEKIVRSSMEYRDYIRFLKEHIGLDSCIFFQNVSSSNKKHVRIELHHEPFTLYDIVSVVVKKFEEEGIPLNDLAIADEVMELHYANKVGLVPLSKTAHEIIHKSNKLMIPLNMVYGNYSEFIEEYEPYIEDYMFENLEKKIDMTNNLTPESFDAIMKEFTYLDVDGYDELEKMETNSSVMTA